MAIFRYFDNEMFAKALVEKGQMLFRSLSHFRNLEQDQVRGDQNDGALMHSPKSGLEITKSDGTVVKMPGVHFSSSVKSGEIFVCCFSNELSKDIAAKFGSPFCVEIENPEEVVGRLQLRANAKSKIDYDSVYFGDVEYRELDAEPGVDWALPEKVAFMKPPEFAYQNESRFVIGTRGVFDPENVECLLVDSKGGLPAAETVSSKVSLELGSLEAVAKLHLFH